MRVRLVATLSGLLLLACLSAKDRSESEKSARNEEAPQAARAQLAESDSLEPPEGGEYRQAGFGLIRSDSAARGGKPTDSKAQSFERAQQAPPGAPQAEPAKRLVVYTALLRMAVDAVQDAFRRAEEITLAHGGHVQSSSLSHRVLRIPSEHYQAALSQLQELGALLELNQSSEDVTVAFSDVVRRIENLRALQQRHLELLAAAESIETRLAIERELRRISQELRELEEKRRVLADRIAFATITLQLEPTPKQVVARSGRVQPFAFVDDYGLSSVLR